MRAGGIVADSGPITEPVPAVADQLLLPESEPAATAEDPLLEQLREAVSRDEPEEFADDPHITDTTKHEWISWAPLLALIVAIGIYPNLVFRVTDGAVDASLTPCLSAEGEEAERLHCADVYKIGHGDGHDDEHAATDN